MKLRGATPRSSRFVGGDTSRIGLAVVCIGLIAYVQLHTGNFVSQSNFDNIFNNLTAALFVAAAAGPLLISGNVDLSIGGMLSLVSVVSAEAGLHAHSSVAIVAAAIGVGVACGVVNGLLVKWLRLSPIIVTIGTGGIYAGLAYMISNNSSVFGFPDTLVSFGRAYVAGVPVVAAIGAATFLLSGLVLSFTVGGLRTYAIGGNRQAARQAGVGDDRHVTALYVLTGVAVALAGIALTARLGSGTPDMGTGFEIDILTALILGGVGFAGGSGRPVGIAIGLVTIEVFNAAAVFLGLSDYFHQVARGGILLLALAGDQFAHRYSGWWRRARERAPVRDRIEPSRAASPADAAGEANGHTAPQAPDVAGTLPVPTLELKGVSKSYGGVVAVEDVDVALYPGRVTCLVGDNGAGKSTLVKLITGVIRPDAGEMRLAGERFEPHTPADARRRGIEAVYQDLALCPNLGATANLILGDEPALGPDLGSLSIVNRRAAAELATQRLREMRVQLRDLNQTVAGLSGGQRQSVAIARAARPGVKLAVLDEPTAALGVGQRRTVLELVRRLARAGVTVVVVSHDVENVMEVADRVVVMRLGRVAFEGPMSALTMERLVLLMAGVGGPHGHGAGAAPQSALTIGSVEQGA